MSNDFATTVHAALASGAVEPLDALYRVITGQPCRDQNALLRLHDALVAAHQAGGAEERAACLALVRKESGTVQRLTRLSYEERTAALYHLGIADKWIREREQ